MLKKGKKICSMLLAAAVSTSALSLPASAEEENAGAMGRFIEEEVALPEEIFQIYDVKVQTDGSVLLLGAAKEKNVILSSADHGATWEEKMELPEELQPTENSYVYHAALSQEGDILAMYSSGDASGEEENTRVYYHCDLSGNLTEIVPAPLEGQAESGLDFFWQLEYIQPGQVLCQGFETSEIYLMDDKTGETVRTFNEDDNYISVWGTAAGNLYALNGEELFVWGIETGEEKENDVLKEALLENPSYTELLSTSGKKLIFTAGTDGNSIYYACEDGLYRHVAEGAVVEQIADGTLNSLGNPAYGLLGMQQTADGAFLIHLYEKDSGFSKLIRLVYSEDTPTVPGKELKVYSLKNDDTVRQAIAMFQKENPDYYIDFEVGITGEDAVTESDALRTLNTDIMAGKGPDILVLDGIPVESYIEKGILADMSGVLEEIAATDGFFENVVKAYEKDGALYAVPSRFTVPVIQGKEELISQVNGLTSLADTVEQAEEETGAVMSVGNIYWYLKSIYEAYAVEFLQEDGSLNEEAVREFVTQTKRIYDLQAEDETYVEWEFGSNRNLSFSLDSISVSVGEFMQGSVQMADGMLDSVMDQMTVCSINEALGLSSSAAKLTDKNVFIPRTIIGINSKSTKQEDAQKLVSHLFSRETQAQTAVGFAVNRAGFEENMEETRASADGSDGAGSLSFANDGSEEMVTLEIRALNDAEEEELRQILESADTPVPTDSVMEGMIIEQTGNCISGQISEEEAIQAIVQKMNLYLSE